MASDIFANNFQFTTGIKNSSGMNSARAREIALSCSQFFRQCEQRLDIDPNISRFDCWKILADLVDARFATKSAAAGNGPETLCGIQFQFHTACEIYDHSVLTIPRNSCDCASIAHDPFGNEKTSSKLIVVTRGTHRRDQGFATNSNFERLFDREIVPQILKRTIFFSPDDSSRTDARGVFHH